MRTKMLALAGALLAAAALPSVAGESRPAGEHPENGTPMNVVESRFGAPATRYPAVGTPPITRWDYPGFVVYFENDLVLHAVVTARN